MGSLELLAPRLLGLLGLLVPLVVLYILKVKRKRRRVGSTWLWQAAQRDLMARSPFKKLIWQVPLFLQALILILLALAATRPATRGKALIGDHLAIIIDTSASMAAVDPLSGKTHLDLAKIEARKVIASLPPGSDAMVIDAGRDARIGLPPDRDTRRMRRAVDRLGPREVEGDMAAAVSMAVGRLSQQAGKRRVLIFTDGHWAKPVDLERAAVPVDVVQVGTPIDNAAIVRVDVRAGASKLDNRDQLQAFLLVANFGKKPRELYVTMRQDNASDTLASRKIVVPPGERQPVQLTFDASEADYGTGLIFDIAPHDALPIDDVAFGRVPSGRRQPVVYLAKDKPSPWLLRAFVSDPQAAVRSGTLDELKGGNTKIGHESLLIVEGACPKGLPGADLLVVNPPPGDCYGTMVGGLLDGPGITSWATADPRMRFLTLDGVQIAKARSLEPESARQGLVRSDKGVLVTDISSNARHATLLGFAPGESNWPLKASFVLFARNLLEQARLHRSKGISGPAKAGDPLRIALPNAVPDVKVTGPDGKPRGAPVRGGLAVVPEVSEIGLYKVAWDKPSPGQQLIVVNLTSAAESDLTKRLAPPKAAHVSVAAAGTLPDAHRDWSWLLALIALIVIVAEVFYLTRKPRVASLAAIDRPRAPPRRSR